LFRITELVGCQAQLRPFVTGLDIAVAAQRLSMRAEDYETLTERVGDALDYEVRWQPDEFESEGFIERVRPLELSYGILVTASCAVWGAAARELRRGHVHVRADGLTDLGSMSGQPDTGVSGCPIFPISTNYMLGLASAGTRRGQDSATDPIADVRGLWRVDYPNNLQLNT
jgi:hypothetical protein